MLTNVQQAFKGAFTHPVYACVYRIALRFFITYLGLLTSMEKKVITSKTQRTAENACGNRMWQLGFSQCSSHRYLLIWERYHEWSGVATHPFCLQFQVIKLICSNQGNYFENTTQCNNQTGVEPTSFNQSFMNIWRLTTAPHILAKVFWTFFKMKR